MPLQTLIVGMGIKMKDREERDRPFRPLFLLTFKSEKGAKGNRKKEEKESLLLQRRRRAKLRQRKLLLLQEFQTTAS